MQHERVSKKGIEKIKQLTTNVGTCVWEAGHLRSSPRPENGKLNHHKF